MTKEDVLALLEKSDAPVSGEQMCRALGMTRAGIWKAIEALRADGFDIEAAHPASAKIALRSSEAQMLGSYSHVDVAVLLVVVAACPAFAVVLHAHDVERSSAEPIAVVRLPKLFLSLLAAHDDKFPRLAVDSRRSQSDALEDVCQVVIAYRLVGIFACREAGL